jgi:CubicO group peptidase (beta-lactamase class C family)
MRDWDRMCTGIGQLSPLWEPGTRSGNHARTMGFVLGELIRRTDGRAFNQFVQQELLTPLGIHDVCFGAPPEVESRIASFEDGPAAAPAASMSEPTPFLSMVFHPTCPRPQRSLISPRCGVHAFRARPAWQAPEGWRGCTRCWRAMASSMECGCFRQDA